MPNEETPNPTPTATQPPPETPPSTPPAPPPQASDDHFMDELKRDLGSIPDDRAPEPVVIDDPKPFVSLGERVKYDNEAAKLKEEQDRLNPPAAPATPPEATPPPVTPPAAPEATIPPATAPTPPPVKVTPQKPFEQIAREAAERVVAERIPANQPPPAPQTPAPVTRDPYEDTLGEVEREELEAARFGAEKYPEKYKGTPEALVKFYKDFDAYIVERRKENADFNGKDDATADWIESHKPRFTRTEVRTLARESIKAEALREADSKREADRREIDERLHRMETTPRVEKAAQDFNAALHDVLATPENGTPSIAAEIAAKAKKEGWEKVVAEDAVLAPIVQQNQQMATRRAKEYLSVVNGIKAFDPNNPDHQWNLQFVKTQAAHFRQNGGAALTRTEDGNVKTFLTPGEFNRLAQTNPEVAFSRHFTWGPEDILGMMADNARIDANRRVTEMVGRMEKSGYKRAAAAPVPASVPTSTPSASDSTPPKSKVSQSPGAATTAPAAKGNAIFSVEEMKSLGLPIPA